MSIGKSSISRLSAASNAPSPKKPEAPEVPAAAVAVPADQVVKKTTASRTRKTTKQSNQKAVSKTTRKPVSKASTATRSGQDLTRAAARMAKAAFEKKATAGTFSHTEAIPVGSELPYWLL